jgi:predicted transglutaminase-like cysteine proteinase
MSLSPLRPYLKPLAGLLLGVWLLGPLSAAQATPQGSAMADAQSAALLASWQLLLASTGGEDDRALLERVNRFVNRSVSFVSDQQAWGQQDYWATPAQTLGRGMGDCEDFAIAKYFSLVRIGVPSEKLRLTFVKALKQNQAHMVLAYYANPNAQPLILDNLDPAIRPASERSDLLPVYSFNDLGVFLAKAPQRVSQPPQFLARWNELSERALADGSAASAPRS